MKRVGQSNSGGHGTINLWNYESLMDAGVAIIDVPVPPFTWVRVVASSLFSMCSVTKFARMALMGEPIGRPKTCRYWVSWKVK